MVDCPRCTKRHEAYFIKTRHQWQCKHCHYRFLVTAGTLSAHHKLLLRDILFTCSLYVNAAKGISALQIACDLNMQYKTAKIKEALKVHKQRESMQLSGIIHMDAIYVHSSQNPKNKKNDRVDRRLKQHENPLKHAILVMRDRFNKPNAQSGASDAGFADNTTKLDAKQIGARNTIAFAAKSENSKVVNNLANKHIAKGSTIHTDKSPVYDNLIYFHDLKRVNHQREYRSDAGVTNNLAESYFSRFKRMYYGQVHKMNNNTYLYEYTNEIGLS